MGWFKRNDTNKNAMGSTEYEDCLRRIIKINSETEILKANLEAYKLQLDNLRGNFSRKLKGMKEEEEKTEEKKTETINNSEFVAFG